MASSAMSASLSTTPIHSRGAAASVTALFAAVAVIGFLGAVLGGLGTFLLGQVCAIGSVEVQGIDPALFHNLMCAGILACSAGVLGLLRPRAA
jgi:hypothetical protein